MNYAWVIDQTKCIGCHACSTACKSENDVPLGVFRTWVKTVEVGEFPNVRRHFAVLRCNHCADAPCVAICPVKAMFQRADGIVDIAHDLCIGCKACMQACPYDAIHIDPDVNTVAKCHFCAHRIDRGLLPACVVVCPVEALVFGDMDDPASRVSRYLGSTAVTVRRPEQNTRPKAFYVGAHEATLDPLVASHEQAYMSTARQPATAKDHAANFSVWSLLRSPRNGNGKGGGVATVSTKKPTRPRSSRSRMPTARVAYDVHHEITWKGRVSAYLWTKSIAAGAVFLAAAARLFGFDTGSTLISRVAPILGMVAIGVTGLLLIADLKRPERFWFILAKPHWRSWLTRGAFIIAAYSALLVIWLGYEVFGATPDAVFWVALPLAFATAVYTAFLFAQCEARDLWQSPLLGLDLTIQMVIAGAATLLLSAVVIESPAAVVEFLTWALLGSLGLHLVAMLLGDVTARHGSSNAAAAAEVMTKGRYAPLFWAALALGTALPGALLIAGSGAALPAVLALLGLLAYEHAFVMSAQSVPIS